MAYSLNVQETGTCSNPDDQDCQKKATVLPSDDGGAGALLSYLQETGPAIAKRRLGNEKPTGSKVEIVNCYNCPVISCDHRVSVTAKSQLP